MLGSLAWFYQNAAFLGILLLTIISYVVGYIDGRLSARMKK